MIYLKTVKKDYISLKSLTTCNKVLLVIAAKLHAILDTNSLINEDEWDAHHLLTGSFDTFHSFLK